MNSKKFYIVKLKGLRYIHIGTGREDYDVSTEMLSSDSISAALAAIRCQQGKSQKIKDFLESFAISSAFPYDGKKLFFPVPHGKLNIKVTNQEEEKYRKKLKKIKFAEKSIWERLVAGEAIEVDENQIHDEFVLSSSIEDCDFQAPYKREILQRVKVDYTEKNDPFYFEWTYFNDNAGLFFLLDGDESRHTEFKDLFVALGEAGIGSDKNLGGGMFTTEIPDEPLILSDSQNADALLLLSTYLPTKDELQQIDLSNSNYRLVLRGGYIAGAERAEYRHLHKKTVHLFQTGSVLCSKSKLNGKVVELTPKFKEINPVYRSGRAITIPVKI